MRHRSEPGVSGKKSTGKAWINADERADQDDFIEGSKEIGRSDNLFGRSDLKDQILKPTQKDQHVTLTEAHILEALERSPEADVSHIKVTIKGHEVFLEGEIADIKEARVLENLVKNIRGVSKVTSDFQVHSERSGI